MVKLKKSVLREGLTIKCEEDYRGGEIFKILLEDCYNKCYLCEQKPIPPEVEHRLTHKGDEALKYNWFNIFYSCRYCNKIKNQTKFYNGIIDPTKIDPEEYIELHMDYENLREKVVIVKKVKDDEFVDITVELLDLIHNNKSTDINREASFNLRNRISKQINMFKIFIKHYQEEPNTGDYDNIMEEISIENEFAAFKRQIIRDNDELFEIFKEAL